MQVIEIEKLKEFISNFIPETEEGTKAIQGIMAAAIDTDIAEPDPTVNEKAIQEAIAAAKTEWDAEKEKEKAEYEAENARKWIAAFNAGVTKEENPKAVEQVAATPTEIEEKILAEPYTKEGALNNGLYR